MTEIAGSDGEAAHEGATSPELAPAASEARREDRPLDHPRLDVQLAEGLDLARLTAPQVAPGAAPEEAHTSSLADLLLAIDGLGDTTSSAPLAGLAGSGSSPVAKIAAALQALPESWRLTGGQPGAVSGSPTLVDPLVSRFLTFTIPDTVLADLDALSGATAPRHATGEPEMPASRSDMQVATTAAAMHDMGTSAFTDIAVSLTAFDGSGSVQAHLLGANFNGSVGRGLDLPRELGTEPDAEARMEVVSFTEDHGPAASPFAEPRATTSLGSWSADEDEPAMADAGASRWTTPDAERSIGSGPAWSAGPPEDGGDGPGSGAGPLPTGSPTPPTFPSSPIDPPPPVQPTDDLGPTDPGEGSGQGAEPTVPPDDGGTAPDGSDPEPVDDPDSPPSPADGPPPAGSDGEGVPEDTGPPPPGADDAGVEVGPPSQAPLSGSDPEVEPTSVDVPADGGSFTILDPSSTAWSLGESRFDSAPGLAEERPSWSEDPSTIEPDVALESIDLTRFDESLELTYSTAGPVDVAYGPAGDGPADTLRSALLPMLAGDGIDLAALAGAFSDFSATPSANSSDEPSNAHDVGHGIENAGGDDPLPPTVLLDDHGPLDPHDPGQDHFYGDHH